jgi:hypothetical protein
VCRSWLPAPVLCTTPWTSEFYYRPDVNRIAFSYAPSTGDSQCCYDTVVSESRIASYIGIAKGELPPKEYYGTWRSFPDTCDWAPRSWGVNHPLTVQAQIYHGLHEAQYGYWGFSPSNTPEGGYAAYGVDGIGMNPTGYASNEDNTFVVARPGHDHGRDRQRARRRLPAQSVRRTPT